MRLASGEAMPLYRDTLEAWDAGWLIVLDFLRLALPSIPDAEHRGRRPDRDDAHQSWQALLENARDGRAQQGLCGGHGRHVLHLRHEPGYALWRAAADRIKPVGIVTRADRPSGCTGTTSATDPARIGLERRQVFSSLIA